MKATQVCRILKKDRLTDTAYRFVLEAPESAAQVSCGQFAHVAVDAKTLRRPISICDFSRDAGTLTLVLEIRGEGTEWIASRQEGQTLDIIAPLGHGFTLGDTSRRAVLVGGGIGTPPLLSVARAFGGNATALLGFRSADSVILEDDFKSCGAKVHIATDDGSTGHHGYVTQLLAKELAAGDVGVVMACGPMPMLKLTAKACEEAGVECQVSLEERMGCGVGACLVCACAIRRNGQEGYSHVCKDGPVFLGTEVVW